MSDQINQPLFSSPPPVTVDTTIAAMIAYHKLLFRQPDPSFDPSTLTDEQIEIIAECLLQPDLMHYKHSLDKIHPSIAKTLSIF
jgi:hypothetical protein